jgi:hypothetical protein
MDALSEPDPENDPERSFEEVIRAAQDTLRRAEERARLAGDPLADGYQALGENLAAIAAHHGLEKVRFNRRLEVMDTRLDEIDRFHAALVDASAQATDAAKAEMGRAQAEIARQAAGAIAAGAARQFKTMTRTNWLRAVAAAAGVVLVTFVTGGALGFTWGRDAAADTIRTADPILQFVARQEGAGAVHDWNTLMRYNPIKSLWAQCSGSKVAVQNGQKACNFWLWIGPPPGFTPKKG